MYRNLKCPNCNKQILSKNIHLDKNLAKCKDCDVLIELQEENNSVLHQRKEEIFVIPRGIEVLKMMTELNIDIKWRHSTNFFMMFFVIFWNMIILPFAIYAILAGEIIFLLGLSIHLLVGIGLIFWALAALFNTTYIVVDEKLISVQHRPFKLFYKEYNLDVNEIDQLYVKRYVNGRTNGNPNYAFALMINMKNKEEFQLLKGINKAPQAIFIEQQIEKFIGVKDKPMAGEF